MSTIRLPSIQINAHKDLPILFFVAGFPDNQISGWGTDIPRELYLQNYHLVFTCLPGLNHTLLNLDQFFDKIFGHEDSNEKRNYLKDPSIIIDNDIHDVNYLKCGFDELALRLHNTLEFAANSNSSSEDEKNNDNILLKKKRISLLGHDWGSYLLNYYLTQLNNKKITASSSYIINKLILFDVGLINPFKIRFSHALLIFFYQIWFCFSFILSYFLSDLLGTIFFRLFFLPIFKCFWPSKNERSTVPPLSIRGLHCYCYFHNIKDTFMMKPHRLNFPNIPTLFLYGTNKNIMFHDRSFLQRLDKAPGYGHKAFVAGHWFHLKKFHSVIGPITEFIKD